MNNYVISHLKAHKTATITLAELESLFTGDTDYSTFAAIITELVSSNILIEKNKKANNGREISLALKYGINKYKLREDLINIIQSYSIKVSKEIDLQEYYNLSEETWNLDLPYIKKINEYITQKGLPTEYATTPERSFHIMEDEKWIDEKSGKALLNRLKLWEKLKISTNSDPLMMAVNSKQFNNKTEYKHLIVENKATFMALIDTLQETEFTSLIFGCGWKIVSNINMLEKQLGIKGTHKLYYFGDLDNEGISIWNSLNERVVANVATAFYSELLKKSDSKGKETQLKNQEALNNFLLNVNNEEKKKVTGILDAGGYLPQEALNKEELGEIWRVTKWG